jgi:TRAP-type C4-dicarboxylate transport system permease small subunit
MKTLNALARKLSRSLYVVAGLALACSMFLTVADVFLRTFKLPIVGTFELIGLFGALVIGFALPQTSRVQGHVLMDFVTSRLSAGIQRILHIITRLLGMGLFIIIGWNMVNLGNDFRRVGEVTPTLQLPIYPAVYAIALCCLVECLVLFVDMIGKGDAES